MIFGKLLPKILHLFITKKRKKMKEKLDGVKTSPLLDKVINHLPL